MSNSIQIEDLDRSLKLLEEYTVRSKNIFQQMKDASRSILISMYSIVVVFVAFYGLIISLQNSFTNFNFPLIIGLIAAMTSLIGITSYYYLRQKNKTKDNKEDLKVTYRQLQTLVKLISQYTEHNDKFISELRKFELNLRLIEAEEILKNIDSKYGLDIQKNESEKDIILSKDEKNISN